MKTYSSLKQLSTLLLLFLLSTTVALAKDIKTVVLTPTPQMHCESCEKKIKKALRYEKGVKDIETNLEKQTVKVKYDADKTSVANLQTALKKAGYDTAVAGDKKSCCGQCAKQGEKKACCGEKKSCGAEKKGCASEKKSCASEKKGCASEKKSCKGEKKSCCSEKKSEKKSCCK